MQRKKNKYSCLGINPGLVKNTFAPANKNNKSKKIVFDVVNKISPEKISKK
jgi:hypothetical protein